MFETPDNTGNAGNRGSAGNMSKNGNAGNMNSTPPLWWNRTVVYWQENQVAITFHSPLDHTFRRDKVIGSLNLETLNRFLNTGGFNLKSFTSGDVLHQPDSDSAEIEILEEELDRREAELEALERSGRRGGDIEEREKNIEELKRQIEQREQAIRDANQQDGNMQQQGGIKSDLNSTIGKYIFRSPSSNGSLVMCFFHSENAGKASSMSGMQSMGGGGGNGMSGADTTQSIVNYLNNNLDQLKLDGNIPIVAAMPNWTGGGTNGGTDGPIGHGCPITPPIPVLGSDICAADPGRFPISLPQLSDTMKGMRGDEVTVYVLDTVPKVDDILSAAARAGNNNLLLAEMVTAIKAGAMVIGDQQVPRKIRTSIRTGKDVYGRLFGFDMPDHGLFVAGIIHDLAPDANIECVRVLNDFGIGTFSTICAALETIQGRMLGPDAPKHVVINLSLVVTPADEELAGLWFDNNCCYHSGDFASMMYEVGLLRAGLHLIIKSLTTLGAVVVASAGNDSSADEQYIAMNTGMSMGMPSNMPLRFGPRYPAAFPEVISVGAVYENGQAASYSNYPALPPNHNGIATHGGNRPQVAPSTTVHPAGSKTWATVSDGIVGVYSSPHYSMLSATDLPPTDYPAPANNYAWAYWAGTSFATPVISALAARVLQARSANAIPAAMSVQETITTSTGQQTILAQPLDNSTAFGFSVTVLKAEQCKPVSSEGVASGPGHAVVHGG
ncbi:MAG: S8 family serine peptidase [Ktedonobacteraceae bacterium]